MDYRHDMHLDQNWQLVFYNGENELWTFGLRLSVWIRFLSKVHPGSWFSPWPDLRKNREHQDLYHLSWPHLFVLTARQDWGIGERDYWHIDGLKWSSGDRPRASANARLGAGFCFWCNIGSYNPGGVKWHRETYQILDMFYVQETRLCAGKMLGMVLFFSGCTWLVSWSWLLISELPENHERSVKWSFTCSLISVS